MNKIINYKTGVVNCHQMTPSFIIYGFIRAETYERRISEGVDYCGPVKMSHKG